MAATTTTLNGTLTAGQRLVTLTAYTAPSFPGNLGSKVLIKIEDEIMLVTDTTLSPTLGVVRGYMGTVAAAHTTGAAAVYGLPVDMQDSKGISAQYPSLYNPAIIQNTQEVTATGATGTTAANITQVSAFLNVTGTSGTGLNLPVPVPGNSYIIKNNSTGAVNIFSVGATINGTTGTTAVAVTATGNKFAVANCATAGAWQVYGNT
jgi:hypothetical protein